MFKSSILLVGVCVFAVGASCNSQEPGATPVSANPAPSDTMIWRGESYRLTAKDTVRVTIFQEDDLAVTARIGSDGMINCPLIGAAKIGGKTVPEATALIQELYLKYLKKPQATVSIVEYAKRRFTILGQVSKPGIFDMPDDSSLNLIEAIGLAGGYTRIADPSHIIVKRIVNGQEIIMKVDGKKMLSNDSVKRVEVLPGDTILVNEGWF